MHRRMIRVLLGTGVALAVLLSRPASARAEGSRAIALWTSIGVAGASLTTALVFDQLALRDLREYRHAPSSDLRTSGETKALVSDIAFGVAGVAAAVAVVLLVVECSSRRGAGSPARTRSASAGGIGRQGVLFAF